MSSPLLVSEWKSPSNIALVKYWGKKNNQEPANASVSFTLQNCFTHTKLEAFEKQLPGISLEVQLNGSRAQHFEPKIHRFFEKIIHRFPKLSDYHWVIKTENTFPHSSGIASSASGMSALSLCLLSIFESEGQDFYREASNISRLGSGSACRSVYGGFTEWGLHPDFAGSSDQYAIPLDDIHPTFQNYGDTILIVHAGSKSVSSSVGHDLVNHSPFATERFRHAQKQAGLLKSVLAAGDRETFNRIVESEALMLHALMMSSDPYFILMKPNTLAIIEKIMDQRKQKQNSFVFTLDAGANVHFLYSKEDENEALSFIQSELIGFCDQGRYICDQVGRGPEKL